MTDKVRIHDFAKQYGMSGKDLAAKLRDFGFSKAKSHMSALDPFDLVTAQGVLEANGIMPASEASAAPEAASGGLRVVKRLKRAQPGEDETIAIETEPDSPSHAPSQQPHGQSSAETPAAGAAARSTTEPPVGSPSAGSHGVGSPSSLEAASSGPGQGAGEPSAPRARPSTEVSAPVSASAAAAEQAAGAAAAERAPGTATEPAQSARPSSPAATEAPRSTDAPSSVAAAASGTGAASGTASSTSSSTAPAPTAGTDATSQAAGAATPDRSSPSASPGGAAAAGGQAAANADSKPSELAAQAAASASPMGEAPQAASAPSDQARTAAPSDQARLEPARGGATADPAREPARRTTSDQVRSGDAARGVVPVIIQAARPAPPQAAPKDPPRRGNVVGFVDPSTFQQNTQKKKASSRRLQSRDDSAPDVRPTLGGHRRAGGPASPQPAATGPRGKLTAAELREREQNRFLRHNRTSQTGHTQGRRSGGGRRSENATESPYAGSEVSIEQPISIAKLADAMALKAALVVSKAWSTGLGMFTINQTVDSETATLIAAEFEVNLEIKEDISAEQAHLAEVRIKRNQLEEEELVPRSPTVAFLGHVDHGKTTLIDKIRATRVAAGESGGITQHVGAYRVKTSKGHMVTIIDTPGHEAFTSMRARGARAVDIVVLVVAGDDGVKPSTIEAINHAKAAKSPIVVAINKVDKQDFNANTVIQQLMGQQLVPEQYGGNTAMFHTSGITGQGIDELLEHIFLMGDIELGLKAHPKGPASGVVLEAEIQQGRGIVAHLLIQDGTLSKGDVILAGEGYGKVRQILDDRGNVIKEAGPSMPVAVTGLDALPGVGDAFYIVDSLAKAKQIATERERTNRAKLLAEGRDPRKQMEALLGREAGTEAKIINLIVRTDVQGTAEVIKSEIAKMGHDEVELKVIHSGVGPITESDVDLATPSQAILLAFKVGVNGKARQNADRAGVDIKRYEVIYELLDDLRALMQGALRPEFEEVVTGHVEIRAIFKSSRIGLIAGCMVIDGSAKRHSLVRLMRDGNVIYTGSFASLRREKDDAKEVREGFECGIVLKDYRDIQQGDIIECYEMKEIKRTL
ncbi:MAG: translation initiation factor IF-2 [Planctomycetota bacterium]